MTINLSVYLTIAFFIFGSIIGSFLNVVLYRINTGRSLGGRSKCFSCRRTLSAFDLVPIISWLFLRGRCRTCKSKISAQYILVEIFTGILFAFVYLKNAFMIESAPFLFSISTVISILIMSILVLMTVYDFRHKIIPNEFSYTFAVIAFAQMFLNFNFESSSVYFGIPWSVDGLMMLLAGPIVAFPFYFLWIVSEGKWMGLGDAKLALGIGWLLGIKYGFSAIVFAFWIGAIVSLLAMGTFALMNYIDRRKNGGLSQLNSIKFKSEIPFAPFLIIGILIVFFLNISALDFVGFLM